MCVPYQHLHNICPSLVFFIISMFTILLYHNQHSMINHQIMYVCAEHSCRHLMFSTRMFCLKLLVSIVRYWKWPLRPLWKFIGLYKTADHALTIGPSDLSNPLRRNFARKLQVFRARFYSAGCWWKILIVQNIIIKQILRLWRMGKASLGWSLHWKFDLCPSKGFDVLHNLGWIRQ